MDIYWGPKKLIFLIRGRLTIAAMAAAPPVNPVNPCPEVCPGRLGSVLYTRKRLHRMRRRFQAFFDRFLSADQDISH